MSKKRNVESQYFYLKLISGCAWIAAGISGCFGSLLAIILRIIFIIVLLISIVLLMITPTEFTNQRSANNYTRAKAAATTLMYYVFCAGSFGTLILYMLFMEKNWDWAMIMSNTFTVLLGSLDLSIALFFKHYQKIQKVKATPQRREK